MNKLSGLPAVDRLIKEPEVAGLIAQWGRQAIIDVLRNLQQQVRSSDEVPSWALDSAQYPARVVQRLRKQFGTGLRPVYNLAGTIIHTNLGRSLLSRKMAKAGLAAATRAVTLEFDLETGRRGDRDKLVEQLLCVLTGAEAATVVNNNAAAVLLVLNSLAEGSPVPVSRGELVEIGGSFRVPEIMQKAGCSLVEIGTTNRTHLKDYEAAIDSDTQLLLKVHPSNYHIAGFTKSVDVQQLSLVAKNHNIPLYIDLGSGALIDLEKFGLPAEPTAGEVLAQGADILSFSGDKLLGSIQAGIIVGKKALIDKIRANPLKRALRVDKITLGILTETFRYYQDTTTVRDNIPLLATFAKSLSEINSQSVLVAEALCEILTSDFKCEVCDSHCQIGSGSLPEHHLASRAVCISSTSGGLLNTLHASLRALPTPVICRVQDERLWMDMRTVTDVHELIENLKHLTTIMQDSGQ